MLLYNLHDCTFKVLWSPLFWKFGRRFSPHPEQRGSAHYRGQHILNSCMVFLFSFLDVIRMTCQQFFSFTTTLWNSFPWECFSLTYDLNCFKFKVDRHLSSLYPFYSAFQYVFLFILFFGCVFLANLSLLVSEQSSLKWTRLSKCILRNCLQGLCSKWKAKSQNFF